MADFTEREVLYQGQENMQNWIVYVQVHKDTMILSQAISLCSHFPKTPPCGPGPLLSIFSFLILSFLLFSLLFLIFAWLCLFLNLVFPNYKMHKYNQLKNTEVYRFKTPYSSLQYQLLPIFLSFAILLAKNVITLLL